MGARFVRLGIAGFKSFADATTVEILPGLTGIVGPNGCGKSNVAEALRWAMGEASARTLRGGEMDDIIFAGTANRPSRDLAEVSLTVAEDEAGLPPPFSALQEVQIVRRIERGTGSSYRVNGREARARDVQTLFADLASGARSSAMVSQGRVGALVNARPEERRAILEEAAGITGLHARRAEAETRLRATEGNLERAEERRTLLTRQMEALGDQARQAARYRTVVAGLQEAEAMLWSIQRQRTRVARDSAAVVVEEARAKASQAFSAARSAAEEAGRGQAVLPGLRAAEADAAAAVERAKAAMAGATAELARAQAALVAASDRKTQLARDLAYAEASLDDAEGIDCRLVAESDSLIQEAAGYPGLLEAAKTEAEQADAVLHLADAAAGNAAAKAAAASARTEAARQLFHQADSRHRRATEALARLAAERQRAEDRLVDPAKMAAAAAGQSNAEAALVEATQHLLHAERDHADATRETLAARDAFNRHDTLRHRLTAESAALAEVLMIKDGERWPPMIDSLSVPPGLEAVLGAALGEELAAAANPDAARHWRRQPAFMPQPIPGSRLSEHVSGPPLLARALGSIGVVQTDAEGETAQAALAPGQCVVSPSGAVWRWDGYTVRAGTPTAAAVRLQQRNRLVQLRQQLGGAVEAAEAARIAVEQARRKEDETAAGLAQCRQRQRTAQTMADRARSDAQALRLQSEAAQSRFVAVDEQLTQLMPEVEVSRTAFETARDVVASQPDAASLQAFANETRTALSAARQREVAASRAVDNLQRGDLVRQTRIGSISRERDDRRMRVEDMKGRVVDLRSRAQDALAEWDRLTRRPDSLRADAATAAARLKDAEAAKNLAVGARQQGEALASHLTAQERASEHASYAAREALLRAEGAFEAAEHALDLVVAQIAERESALPPLPDQVEASAQAEDRARSRMSRLMKERDQIGPVNLRAEIEASAIELEIGVIVHERDELASAIAKLRGSIGHLNREGRERLAAVFQQVDRHFQALFSRMFGGGRAHLALVGSDDPLQAGVEIYAQPPGKKLAALSLLSGGEQALTALSLIFAVFRCNPAPLCVLDEVDAPLDDANVGRFCALLADMVREAGTRFLVVTHHQVTMAAMDRLYGVTMQERGISRLLSVDLSRAVDMVEAAAAAE